MIDKEKERTRNDKHSQAEEAEEEKKIHTSSSEIIINVKDHYYTILSIRKG